VSYSNGQMYAALDALASEAERCALLAGPGNAVFAERARLLRAAADRFMGFRQAIRVLSRVRIFQNGALKKGLSFDFVDALGRAWMLANGELSISAVVIQPGNSFENCISVQPATAPERRAFGDEEA
jgi:hypothetical protein